MKKTKIMTAWGEAMEAEIKLMEIKSKQVDNWLSSPDCPIRLIPVGKTGRFRLEIKDEKD